MKTVLALSLTALAAAANASAGTPAYTQVELQARSNLLVNDEGFNLPPGTSFNSISPAINDAQQVAFTAGVVPIDGDQSHTGGGVWLGAHGEGAIVALHELPPGGDPEDPPFMIVADTPGLNASGMIAYYTSVGGGTYTLRKYDPATGESNPVSLLPMTPSAIASPTIADDGLIGFRASMNAGYGIATAGNGSTTIYAVSTGVDETSPYAFIYSPAMDNAHRIASKVSTSDYNHNEIRLFNGPDQSELVVADRATDAASPFAGFDNNLGLNQQNAIAVTVKLADGNVRALYRFTPGDGAYLATEIARVDPAGTIRDIESFAPAINDAGLVAFRAKDENGQAIYVGDGKSLVRVIGAGDIVATDLGSAQIGQHDDSPVFSGKPAINGLGDVAFIAGVHPEGDNQVEWGSGVFVAYAPTDDTIFRDGFDAAP